ncbi:MAG TPA: hypothetical protein VLZ07_02005, partial [Syntrophales bacterium]|nr:hypothetical protein [Syntrophales bacterium]
MKRFLRMICCTVCITIIFLFLGCSGALFRNYGRITPDLSVKDSFEKYQISPNYNYFISGSDVYPIA